MASEPMPIALVAFRKSAGLLPGALRAASDENMDRGPAELCTLWVLMAIDFLCCTQQCGFNDPVCRPFPFGTPDTCNAAALPMFSG